MTHIPNTWFEAEMRGLKMSSLRELPDLAGRAAPKESPAGVAGNGPVVEVDSCRAPAHAALRLQHGHTTALLSSLLTAICYKCRQKMNDI